MTIFTPMTIRRLAAHVADEAGADRRWSLLLEFLEEYEHEPAIEHRSLVEAEPARTGDARWDALLAGIAEWLAARDSFPALHLGEKARPHAQRTVEPPRARLTAASGLRQRPA